MKDTMNNLPEQARSAGLTSKELDVEYLFSRTTLSRKEILIALKAIDPVSRKAFMSRMRAKFGD